MRIASIHTYPIKGCYRVDHATAEVEPWGLRGDRRWLIVHPDTGRAVTQREIPGLTAIKPTVVDGAVVLRADGHAEVCVPEPHGARLDVTVWGFTGPATPAGAVADRWLSEALGAEVRLVWMDDPRVRAVDDAYGVPGDVVSFADGYPLLVGNAASLDCLNDWITEGGSLEGPLPMARFRPNIVVEGAPAWAEDGWTGRSVRIGDVVFRAPKPCARCVVTTTDQETGERGHEPLRSLARHRNVNQDLLFGLNLIPDARGTIRVGDAVSLVDG